MKSLMESCKNATVLSIAIVFGLIGGVICILIAIGLGKTHPEYALLVYPAVIICSISMVKIANKQFSFKDYVVMNTLLMATHFFSSFLYHVIVVNNNLPVYFILLFCLGVILTSIVSSLILGALLKMTKILKGQS